MGDDVKIETHCGECSTLLDERTDAPPEERSPCPVCGSAARLIKVEMTARVRVVSSFRARAKHEEGSWFHEQLAGKDYSVSRGRWMEKVRSIDREKDWYDEVITHPETGDVVHETHEPLSKHRDHGTAKRPRPNSKS